MHSASVDAPSILVFEKVQGDDTCSTSLFVLWVPSFLFFFALCLRFFDMIVLPRFNVGWQSGELYATSSGDNCMRVLKPSLSHVASLMRMAHICAYLW